MEIIEKNRVYENKSNKISSNNLNFNKINKNDIKDNFIKTNYIEMNNNNIINDINKNNNFDNCNNINTKIINKKANIISLQKLKIENNQNSPILKASLTKNGLNKQNYINDDKTEKKKSHNLSNDSDEEVKIDKNYRKNRTVFRKKKKKLKICLMNSMMNQK